VAQARQAASVATAEEAKRWDGIVRHCRNIGWLAAKVNNQENQRWTGPGKRLLFCCHFTAKAPSGKEKGRCDSTMQP
jgi:hypothetical protein